VLTLRTKLSIDHMLGPTSGTFKHDTGTLSRGQWPN
jgi:hypothetical protein